MVAVEDLVVGEDGEVEVVVDEAGMQGMVHRREGDTRLFVAEDALQAVRLLLAVGKDVEVSAIVVQRLEGLDEEVEVLVEDGLRVSTELD